MHQLVVFERVGVAVALHLDVIPSATGGARGDTGIARVDPETGTQTVVPINRIRVSLPLRHRRLMLPHEATRVRPRMLVERGGLLDADTLDSVLLLVREGGVRVEEGVEGVGVRFLI